METGDPLVSAAWLMDNLHAPDLRLVDATWVPPFLTDRKSGRACYDEAHIPNAVFFNIDEIADRESGLAHMLPDPVQFSAQVRKLGLGDGHRLVIYDSNSFFASARVWWMFRAMGHKDILVLDGGLNAWQEHGGMVEDLPPVPPERHFTSRKRSDLVRDMSQMRKHAEKADAVILDARDPGRFDGSAPEPRAGLASGHIPGSFCVPVSRLVTPGGTMATIRDIQSVLGEYAERPIVTTCGSGVSAAIIALALARIGHWDAAVYDGSWSEWAANADNPIATGS